MTTSDQQMASAWQYFAQTFLLLQHNEATTALDGMAPVLLKLIEKKACKQPRLLPPGSSAGIAN